MAMCRRSILRCTVPEGDGHDPSWWENMRTGRHSSSNWKLRAQCLNTSGKLSVCWDPCVVRNLKVTYFL